MGQAVAWLGGRGGREWRRLQTTAQCRLAHVNPKLLACEHCCHSTQSVLVRTMLPARPHHAFMAIRCLGHHSCPLRRALGTAVQHKRRAQVAASTGAAERTL